MQERSQPARPRASTGTSTKSCIGRDRSMPRVRVAVETPESEARNTHPRATRRAARSLPEFPSRAVRGVSTLRSRRCPRTSQGPSGRPNRNSPPNCRRQSGRAPTSPRSTGKKDREPDRGAQCRGNQAGGRRDRSGAERWDPPGSQWRGASHPPQGRTRENARPLDKQKVGSRGFELKTTLVGEAHNQCCLHLDEVWL